MFFYIQRTRDPVLPCYLIPIFSGVFLLFLVAYGGVDNLGSLWSYGYPMIVLFLLGNKKGTMVLSIYLICVMLILFLPGTPLLFTNYTISYKIEFVTGFIMISIIQLVIALGWNVGEIQADSGQITQVIMDNKTS